MRGLSAAALRARRAAAPAAATRRAQPDQYRRRGLTLPPRAGWQEGAHVQSGAGRCAALSPAKHRIRNGL